MSQNLRSALTVLYIGKLETTHTETLHIPPRTGYLTESQISVLTVKGLECPRTYDQHSKLFIGVNTGSRVFVIIICKYVCSLVFGVGVRMKDSQVPCGHSYSGPKNTQ